MFASDIVPSALTISGARGGATAVNGDWYTAGSYNGKLQYNNVAGAMLKWESNKWVVWGVHGGCQYSLTPGFLPKLFIPCNSHIRGNIRVISKGAQKVNRYEKFRIKMVQMENQDRMHGWWLNAQAWYDSDKRNTESTHVNIHKPAANNPTGWSAVWELVPLGGKRYRIKMVHMENQDRMHGWWLNAQAWFDKDKRNTESTYVNIHKPAANNPTGWSAVWELVPA